MTQKQPEALRLADEFRLTMPTEVMRLWGVDSCAELRRLHEEVATLKAERDGLLKQLTIAYDSLRG